MVDPGRIPAWSSEGNGLCHALFFRDIPEENPGDIPSVISYGIQVGIPKEMPEEIPGGVYE